MIIDKNKVKLVMARACMNTKDLQKKVDIPRPTINGALSGRSVTPRTIGLIAKALNVDVTEILIKDK